MRIALIILFYLFLHNAVAGRQLASSDSIAARIAGYAKEKGQSVLFVHFDKNVYTSNETAWFTGYIVKDIAPLPGHNVLSMFLLRARDSSIIQEEKYLLSGSFCPGFFKLQDSLEQGNYFLVSYTNVFSNGRPDAVFIQPITIKTPYDPSYSASLILIDSITETSTEARILLKAYDRDVNPLTGKQVEYNFNGKKVKTKTDKNGEAGITIPIADIRNNALITAVLKNSADIKQLELKIPLQQKNVSVKFYPEGGSLVEELPCTTGWEAIIPGKGPLLVQGVLMKNGIPQDTVATDGYGMGRFRFTPQKDAAYTFRLLGYNTDTVFQLPQLLSYGVALHIGDALPSDTLSIEIRSNIGEKLYVTVHNYSETLYSAPLAVKPGRRQLFKVVIPPDMPRGIAAVTITDDFGRAVAERLVFLRFRNANQLKVEMPKKSYGTRDPVELTLTLDKALSSNAVVSVSCVQDNRILPEKMTDIESYTYLDNIITSSPFKMRRMEISETNKAYLENVLLIKGWRRYKWQDVLTGTATDSNNRYSFIDFKGRIAKSDKYLKKPVELSLAGTKSLHTIVTDSSGHFSIPADKMVGSGILVFVNEQKQNLYNVILNDPFIAANKIAAGRIGEFAMHNNIVSNTNAWTLPKNERIRMLEEVVVSSAKANETFFGSGPNACGDYVCDYNILNCTNHSTGRPPVAGKEYFTRPAYGLMTKVIYAGCVPSTRSDNSIFWMKGINSLKEFYVPDSIDMKVTEPLLRSTLLWKHLVALEPGKPLPLHFYTADVTGRFRVIVQGITEEGVVFSEGIFEVKK